MAQTHARISSPTFTEVSREDSVTPSEYKPTASNYKMLKIQSLLNPSSSNGSVQQGTREASTPPPTPSHTAPSPSVTSNPRPDTSGTTTSTKREKLVKDTAAWDRNSPKCQVNYQPFESYERPICLSNADHQELIRQHKIFKIKPSDASKDGLIGSTTRYIPYSSEKKGFHGKTGRDGFNVFEYNFYVPGDDREHKVLWDYENGLTRVTPFFKACKYSKTTPAKALNTTPGVKELAISVTGGALAAQGYWVPYACARDICLTFAYDIRWALTIIFGPSFVRECLRPNHPEFGRFKVAPETVRCAQLEAEDWKGLPVNTNSIVGIPRSVPQEHLTGGKVLRPRAARPTFKLGSPFPSDADDSDDIAPGGYGSSGLHSPAVSPKTTVRKHSTTPKWTSINRHVPPPPPQNTPVGSLSHSLLTQPQHFSWRPADSDEAERQLACTIQASSGLRTTKRRRSSVKRADPDANYKDSHSGSDAGSSSSESDDVDIILSPPANKKRTLYKLPGPRYSSPTTRSSTPVSSKGNKSIKYTAEDHRAAKILLDLTSQDTDLATAPGGPVRELH